MTQLTKLKIALGVVSTYLVIEEVRLVRLGIRYNALRKAAQTVVEITEEDEKTRNFLLHLFNKYEIPVDEFEEIALNALHIEMVEKTEGP